MLGVKNNMIWLLEYCVKNGINLDKFRIHKADMLVYDKDYSHVQFFHSQGIANFCIHKLHIRNSKK